MVDRGPLTLRKVPRQERSKATVDAVLEATARLLERGGLEALNTNDVARVAGVSIGSLYQYFPSKASLLSELYLREREGMLQALGKQLEAADGTPADLAPRLVQALQVTWNSRPVVARILARQVMRLGALEKGASGSEQAIGLIAAFLARHELASPDHSQHLAFVLFHAVDGVLCHALLTKKVDGEHVVEHLETVVRSMFERS